VAQHLKLILAERGAMDQSGLDALLGWCVMAMLTAGVAGRFFFGWAGNRMSKEWLVVGAAALMCVALRLLMHGDVRESALWFSPLFGFGLSADFLTVPLLAMERFRSKKALGVMVPVNTLGQTWFPYVVALVWGATGGYEGPVLLTQALLVVGAVCVFALRFQRAEN
jgi:predicted MFS family arabinose efflux permease